MIEENEKNCESNIVYIGSKETINYITYALSQLLDNETKEVILSARGNLIQKAIFVACALKFSYIHDLNFRTEIGSELIESNNIPSIKIHLSKFACVM